MSFEAAVHAQAIELNKTVLTMTAEAGSGHPTSAMSLGHIVTTLMFSSMRWSPDYPDYPTSDRLVLSEGHAVPVVYAAACKLGVMAGKDPADRQRLTMDDANSLRDAESVLDGHPNPREGFPFFDAATGSLGQGLSVSCGLAEAAALDGISKRIYCIIGDGESREGNIWEAVDYIVDRNLNSILSIFNCNEYGQADRVSDQQSAETIAKKLEAYGIEAHVIDGHDPAAIKQVFEAFAARAGSDGKPLAMVARTTKGWGAPAIQGGGWHGKPATGDMLKRAIAELDEVRVELTSSLVSTDQFTIEPPPEATPKPEVTGDFPTFNQMMRSIDQESVIHSGRMATRKAYGVALRALGNLNPDIVAVDADVSNSTYSETFARDGDLAERFFESKIAEQHMFSMGNGFSAGGKVPFCSTFAKFVTRGYDQIEMAMNSGANLKVIGSHAGITLAADGPSQMSLPDVAWFRALTTVKDHRGNPGCFLLQPADAYAAYSLTAAMAEYEGLCYMRTLRADTEFIYSDDQVFNLGGFEVLNKGRDLLLCASGYMVHEANRVIEMLDNQGISASLVDLYSIPFDRDRLLDVAADSNGYVITLEDNYGAGIGSAVADALLEAGDSFTLTQMHVDRIPKSARTPAEMLSMCNIDAQSVVNEVMKMLQLV